MFSKDKLDILKQNVSARMSEKRFVHTLGVADMAVKLGRYFIPECIDELYVAALLHDIAKEMSSYDIEQLINDSPGYLSDDDIASGDVVHSLVAPLVIIRDFPSFATQNVLKAVYNHTLGDENMDIFSEIIFISDFIEMNRSYQTCIKVREFLLSNLSFSQSMDENKRAIKRAIYEALDFTVNYVREKKGYVHPKSILVRNAYHSMI